MKGTTMPRFSLPRSLRSTLLAGATGWLLAAGAVAGCAGSLDPSLTGSGGNNGTGSGGSTGSGGGGATADCTGSNDPQMILTTSCGSGAGCHIPGGALSAGLDLTPDSNIGSRLVGVKSSGSGQSMCGSNTEPYLMAGSNPATGLFIDKLGNPPCGLKMPEVGSITATQVQCLKDWATTLTK
jgi:hypothetical protein